MLDLPNITSKDRIAFADWVELACLTSQSGMLSQADIADVIHDAGWLPAVGSDGFPEDDELSDGTTDFDDAVLSFAEEAWATLRHRAQVTGGSYPFDVGVDVLSRRDGEWSAALSFTALLLIASVPRYPEDAVVPQYAGISYQRQFEKIVQAAAVGLFKGSAARFGVPRENDWPVAIEERVGRLGDELGLLVQDLTGKVQPNDGDKGLDVASRYSFGDDGPATLTMLFQCATGKHWRDKLGEPSIAAWQDMLKWDSHLVRALAVPLWMDGPEDYARNFRRFDGAVIVDRPRLMAGAPDSLLDDGIRTVIQGWCQEQISKLPILV